MEKKEITLEFGKKYRVGNFVVFKHNRVLRRSEVEQLRNQMGIPADLRKHLQRSQLPYIKVEAISGIWAVQFCCNTNMYMFIDHVLAQAIKADEEGVEMESNSLNDYSHFFTMFFTDTTVLGDSIYTADKANALKAYMERHKAFAGAQETHEEKAEDDKILDELRKDEETKATIVDMAGTLKGGEA